MFQIVNKNIFGETVMCAEYKREDGEAIVRIVRETEGYGKYISVPNFKDLKVGFTGRIKDACEAIENDEGDLICEVEDELWVVRFLDRETGEKLRKEQLEKIEGAKFGWTVVAWKDQDGKEHMSRKQEGMPQDIYMDSEMLNDDETEFAVGLNGEILNKNDDRHSVFSSYENASSHIIGFKRTGFGYKPIQCVVPAVEDRINREYEEQAKKLSDRFNEEYRHDKFTDEMFLRAFHMLDEGKPIHECFKFSPLFNMEVRKVVLQSHKTARSKYKEQIGRAHV